MNTPSIKPASAQIMQVSATKQPILLYSHALRNELRKKKNSSAPNHASIINAHLACMPPILKTKNANAASLPIQGQRNIPSQCIHAVLKHQVHQ